MDIHRKRGDVHRKLMLIQLINEKYYDQCWKDLYFDAHQNRVDTQRMHEHKEYKFTQKEVLRSKLEKWMP